jgi:serine/threonine-protein kinase
MPLTSGKTFAGYRIVRLLGSGGMGEVYLAEHPRLPRRDALKVLTTDVSADSEYRARFNREADLASTLWHPHIVSVHDRGGYDGQLWISMDYVDGLDAARLLAGRFPAGMPTHQVVRIVTAVASALDYAHKQGLLHRDVKPANIMLTHLDDDADEQRILLADFGIARNVDDISGLTTTNMTVGTVAYAAPEQLMGEEIDGRADQYALAATAYQLLTGLQLFPHSNPAVVISRHLNTDPPKLANTSPGLAPLDAALSRALAKNPDNRFARCQGFAQALANGSGTAVTAGLGGNSASTQPAPTAEAKFGAVDPQSVAEPPRRRVIRTATGISAVLTLAVIGALVFVGVRLGSNRQPSPAPTAAPPAPTTSVAAPPPPPSPISPTTTTMTIPTTTTTTTATHALPVAVVGSGCRPESTPTVDPDGVTVYCARIQYTDGFVWSRIAEMVPYPRPLDSPGGPPIDEQICAQQTGRSISYCATAISQATYQGDGPTGCPPGVEACGG